MGFFARREERKRERVWKSLWPGIMQIAAQFNVDHATPAAIWIGPALTIGGKVVDRDKCIDLALAGEFQMLVNYIKWLGR